MKVGELVNFHDERFFEGAVQLRWAQERAAQAELAARAFVFHGPRYHGADGAENEGIEGGYRLKDSASFLDDLISAIQDSLLGKEINPYWLVVAGYGSGKSHLALTCATLLGDPHGANSQKILENIVKADESIGTKMPQDVARLTRPVLVLALDGMSGFHLGNALSQAVFAQLDRYGIDAGAIRALSPRFQLAEQFVERNFIFRANSFAKHLPGMTAEDICSRLKNNDEEVYNEVDSLFFEANGAPIPVVGQESAQDLINTLCDVYCGPDGAFLSVVILFDEFGRYLEYAAEKPQLAGDAVLQQIFQGVQDNATKIRFVGFIQYELKSYLKRFASADLRQLQRYITRFDSAQKWYLSTNLETLFAHMIGKKQPTLTQVWQQANAENSWQESWQQMRVCLPGYERFPVWRDAKLFLRVIAQGCWPLHPLATWFLTRQRDVVQSRSALTFIREMMDGIASDSVLTEGRLRQVSASELVLGSMLPEMIAAERETGSTTAETLQFLLEKFQAHLSHEQRLVLAGVAILEKMRIGKQSQEGMHRLLCEATVLSSVLLNLALQVLNQELGAIEWNRDLGQYELIADASTRGQFQQWLRKQKARLTVDAIRDLFVRRGATDTELSNIPTDFAQHQDIRTPDWHFDAQFSHSQMLEKLIKRVFHEWEQATTPTDAKGKLIYLYIHPDEDIAQIELEVRTLLQAELTQLGYSQAPIWVLSITDRKGTIAEHIGCLHLFDEQTSPEERERFRRFVPEERERSRTTLKDAVHEAIKERLYWIAGFVDVPNGRVKQVGEAVFRFVYPKTVPFPFDGFATSAGGGPADCAKLTRNLIIRKVSGSWMQGELRRMQNRVSAILVHKWKVLLPNGELANPAEEKVKIVFHWLKKCHQDDPKRTLWTSFKALLAPPYGMNASSAGLLLGLLIGGSTPRCRIEHQGEITASGDWVNEAFPVQSGRHFLKQAVLEKSTLHFLSGDSEELWRGLLNRWEMEENFQEIINISHEVEQMTKVEPRPESLEGRYLYLRDRAEAAWQKLKTTKEGLDQLELGIERALNKSQVGELLRMSTDLIKKQKTIQDNPQWPEEYVRICDALLTPIQEVLPPLLQDWISRQSCNTAVQVSDFRHRMKKAVESLDLLGLKPESRKLEQQVSHSIVNINARQQHSLTLAESDDYPRQSGPTQSTPVRDLLDEIKKGNELIKGVKNARSVLNEDETTARINAIKARQQHFIKSVQENKKALGGMLNLTLDNERALHESLGEAKRLREMFIGTRDESEVNDIVVQLERLLADIDAWESGSVSVERLEILLQQQILNQLSNMDILLNEQEIDPAWDMAAIYQALAAEHVSTAQRRSSDWLAPRLARADDIEQLDRKQCIALDKELSAAPEYLSESDLVQTEKLLDAVRHRRSELDEQVRRDKLNTWQQKFLSLSNIETIEKQEVEQLLKMLRRPPKGTLPEELAPVQAIETQLIAHLDKMGVDDIFERTKRLPSKLQHQLLKRLSEHLGIVNRFKNLPADTQRKLLEKLSNQLDTEGG